MEDSSINWRTSDAIPLQTIADTANQLVGQGNQSGKVTGLFTSFTANDPQYLVRIDREKAKSLQVPLKPNY